MSAPDIYQLIAQRDHRVPDGWVWYSIRGVIGGVLVKGAVCTVRHKSGKRPGDLNWDKRDKTTDLEFVASDERIARASADYERETGSCVQCGGSGQALAGWSTTSGNDYRPCLRCAASGRAPERAP